MATLADYPQTIRHRGFTIYDQTNSPRVFVLYPNQMMLGWFDSAKDARRAINARIHNVLA